MITVNITLFVQILHFLIAYLLISRLVLKPGLVLVRREQQDKEQALHQVAVEQAVAAQKQETKHQRWQLCQDYFSEHKPSLQVKFMHISGVTRKLQPDVVSEQQINELAHTIITALKPVSQLNNAPKARHD
jgi:ribosomal protein S7